MLVKGDANDEYLVIATQVTARGNHESGNQSSECVDISFPLLTD